MAEEIQAAFDESAYKAQVAEMVKGSLEGMGVNTDPPPAEKPKEEPKKDEDAEKPAVEDEESKEGEEAAEGDEDEGDDEKKPKDEKYSTALRKLQKEEQRLAEFKTQVLARERDIQQREHKTKEQEAEIASFIRSLRVDPYNTLLKAGLLNEDDAEYISKQLYYNSKAAASDPKSKAEADRIRRERETHLENQENRRRLERLEREREEERGETKRQQELTGYVSRVDQAVEAQKQKHPLLAKALEKNPSRTRQELFKIANDLSYAKQAYADPGLVILAWVKERKSLLSDLGINEPAKPPEKVQSKPAAEKRGIPDAKQPGSSAQAPDDDAYQKELRARLRGEWSE